MEPCPWAWGLTPGRKAIVVLAQGTRVLAITADVGTTQEHGCTRPLLEKCSSPRSRGRRVGGSVSLGIAGVFDGADESVLRGRYDQDGFLAFFFRQRKLVGAVALNRPRELRIAQHLISRQADVANFDLGNEGVSLKTVLASRPDTMTAARS